jgi:predicted nucleic acid-binding protein
MMQIVVDTDVVSFLFKSHPIGLRYDPELAGRVALISFMTVAELERWAIQYRWGEHRLDWLHLYLKGLRWCRPARISAANGPR